MTDEQMAALPLSGDRFHGDWNYWNYTISPAGSPQHRLSVLSSVLSQSPTISYLPPLT